MQIKSVIFDYGGVLCFHPRDQLVDELAGLCGTSRDEFLRAYWGRRAAYDRGDLSPEEYWDGIARSLGRSYADSEVREFRRRDVGFWVNIDQRMLTWARRIRDAGYRTAVLSNLPRDLGEHMRSERTLLAAFDHHTFSYEVRAAKPSPEIYRDVIKKLGVEPGEALFLDDRQENIDAARQMGIVSVLFESPAQLSGELRRLTAGAGNELSFSPPPVVLE